MKTADVAISSAMPRVLGKEHSGSPLAWGVGFFFAFRICITFLAFQGDPRLGTFVTLTLSLFLFAAAFVQTLGDREFSMSFLAGISTLRWLALYLLLVGTSLLWTEAESRAVAAGYWGYMALDAVLAVMLVRGTRAAEHLDGMLCGFVMGSLIVAAVAWMSPLTHDLRLGNNEFLHPNGLGLEFSLALFAAQHLTQRDRKWRWAAVLLGISLLRTVSKTSILACMIVETFYLLRENRLSRRTKIWIVSGAALVVLVSWSALEAYFTYYASEGNSAETLTGRVPMWLMTIALGSQEPWLGHGAYSFRALIPAFGTFQPDHAHNEVLQQFFEYGVAGVAVMLGLYLSLVRRARKSLQSPYGKLVLLLCIFALIHGLTDTLNFGLSLPLWFFAAASVVLTREQMEKAGVRQ